MLPYSIAVKFQITDAENAGSKCVCVNISLYPVDTGTESYYCFFSKIFLQEDTSNLPL